MHPVERRDAAAVIVPGGTCHVACCGGILHDMERIIDLWCYIVEIVIMVEEQDLGLQAGLRKGRAHGVAYEVALLFPGHIERHRIAAVQRLVLESYGVYGIAALFHLLDPEDEIVGIFLIAYGIQAP